MWWSYRLGQGLIQSYTMSLVITTYSIPSRPTCLSHFSVFYHFPTPSYPLPPPPVALVFLAPLYLYTRSPPPLWVWYVFHLEFSHTCHLPASDARLCIPRHVPASAAISRGHSTPLCRPWPAPRSLSDPGVSPSAGPSVSLVSRLPPCVMRCFPESYGYWSLYQV